MPDITINNKNDLVSNLKRVTQNILYGDSQPTKTCFTEPPTDEVMKENLLYFLLGFETEHINIKNNEVEINPLYKNKYLIYPFKTIALNMKEVKRFIRQMQFANDFCKQTLSGYLSLRVEELMLQIVENIENDIETLYVKIQMYADEFKEHASVINEISSMSGLEVYNYFFLKQINSRSMRYENVIIKLKDEMDKKVFNWCINSKIDKDFFIIKNTNELDFDECFWKDRYNCLQNLPIMFKKQSKKILNLGLMQKILKTHKNKTFHCKEFPVKVESLYEKTHEYFQNIILKNLCKEIENVHKTYFITNYSIFLDFYDDNIDKILVPQEMIQIKTKQYQFDFEIEFADTRINHFILKVLNVESRGVNVRRSIFENLSINYKPELFSLFFSSKIYFELGIIFRFMLQLHNFEYIIVKRENSRFKVLIITFISYFKSVIYTNIVSGLKIENTIEMIPEFELFLKSCLKKLYFTNDSVFKILSDIFDIVFEYIYCKTDNDDMYKKTMALFVVLRDELLKQSDDFGHLFYICRIIK